MTDDRPLPRTPITRTYHKALALRAPGVRSLGLPQLHIVAVERWHSGRVDHVRQDPKALCGVAVMYRRDGEPAEATCRACLRIFAEVPGPGDCRGSAMRWLGGRAAPACPRCGRTAAVIGEGRPDLSAAKLAAIVPRHAR